MDKKLISGIIAFILMLILISMECCNDEDDDSHWEARAPRTRSVQNVSAQRPGPSPSVYGRVIRFGPVSR
ncbi:MAG: hypothetical protein HQK57_13225 [Deltaproteobacteria bacterium]|nr:hypothetical protein [Deltaproteobacteria bacterium]MBF0527079.1 hypothetical protein [Deltaproteobacteria bacterium]